MRACCLSLSSPAVALAVAPFGGHCADDSVAAAARLHYGADDAIGLSAAAPLNGGADSTIGLGLSAEARVDDLACSLYSVVGSLVVTYIGGISAASFCTVACIDSIADGPCNAVRYFIRGLVEQPQALYSEGHFPLVDRELLDYVEGGDVRTTACPGPPCPSLHSHSPSPFWSSARLLRPPSGRPSRVVS